MCDSWASPFSVLRYVFLWVFAVRPNVLCLVICDVILWRGTQVMIPVSKNWDMCCELQFDQWIKDTFPCNRLNGIVLLCFMHFRTKWLALFREFLVGCAALVSWLGSLFRLACLYVRVFSTYYFGSFMTILWFALSCLPVCTRELVEGVDFSSTRILRGYWRYLRR